jgi:site-specific recombinase XerD
VLCGVEALEASPMQCDLQVLSIALIPPAQCRTNLQAKMAKKPSALSIADLDAPVILSFLESLERQGHNQAQSRNVRLTAIRSFFRLVALRDPASVGVATRVLAIPLKRTDQHLVGYLTRPEVDAILAANQLTEWSGRRDHALLLSLYNTGARVSEIISLQRPHFSFGVKSFVQFNGKGRKERAVPLWHSTSKALQAWFRELDDSSSVVAFPNARGSSLTRDGVNSGLESYEGEVPCSPHYALVIFSLSHANPKRPSSFLIISPIAIP